jgi:competence protein ComEA
MNNGSSWDYRKKQIRSIRKYESRGGTFRSKADLRKMYAIGPSLYEKLEPFISIPEAGGEKKNMSRLT